MKMKHTGMVKGSGDLYPSYQATFRETKTMWIEADGTKWRKRDGYQPGVMYPRRRLELSTIQVLP